MDGNSAFDPTSGSESLSSQAGDRSEFEHTDRLFALIERRLQTAEQLGTLSTATTDAAQADAPEALMSVLGKKQHLIECLLAIQEELKAFQADDPERRIWESQAKRQQCKDMVDRSGAILAEVMRQDEAHLQQATTQREAIAAQLQLGMNEKAARQAYSSTQNTPGRLLDIGGV
jgi:hypothetical protein